jgi:hypothetical protein
VSQPHRLPGRALLEAPVSLPLRFAPDVSIDDPRYKAGFAAGFVSPRKAVVPVDKGRAYLAGWLDSRERSAVPDWRLEAS